MSSAVFMAVSGAHRLGVEPSSGWTSVKQRDSGSAGEETALAEQNHYQQEDDTDVQCTPDTPELFLDGWGTGWGGHDDSPSTSALQVCAAAALPHAILSIGAYQAEDPGRGLQGGGDHVRLLQQLAHGERAVAPDQGNLVVTQQRR